MLKRITRLQNIGRFRDLSPPPDVELKRHTLIQGDNGLGKSTLVAVLRSLQSGDGGPIMARTTLDGDQGDRAGRVGQPAAKLLLTSGNVEFKDDAWSRPEHDIVVFDPVFINDNVYAGETVGTGQLRSLHGLVIGSGPVELAHRLDELDTALKQVTAEIRRRRDLLTGLVPSGMSLDEFLALEKNSGISAGIEEKERELRSFREAKRIADRPGLSELRIPCLSDRLEAVLSETPATQVSEAEGRVAAQLNLHRMDRHGETWLRTGLACVHDNSCPFCGQDLAAARELLEAYAACFDDSYGKLVQALDELEHHIESELGQSSASALETALQHNDLHVEFWSRYCGAGWPDPVAVHDARNRLGSLREALLALVEEKRLAPHRAPDSKTALRQARAELSALAADLAAYNEQACTSNRAICAARNAANASTVGPLEAELAYLRALELRNSKEVSKACRTYSDSLAVKSALTSEKTKLRRELGLRTAALIERFEKNLNRVLGDFGAGFRVGGMKEQYPGGVASTKWEILVKHVPVALGSSRTPAHEPQFGSVLSAGDRAVLALAFFLVHLAEDRNLARKLVVIDDPFGPLDESRRRTVVEKIARCGDLCGQLIVLSHDGRFLEQLGAVLRSGENQRAWLNVVRADRHCSSIVLQPVDAALELGAVDKVDHT